MSVLGIGDWEQTELFPKASTSEISAAKNLLGRYRRMRLIVDDFEKIGAENLAPKQLATYETFKKSIQLIDRAIALILDEEIKRIMDLRYIKGERHKITVLYFCNMMHAATVDRKINKGIESVANTLKLLGDEK